MILKNYSYYNLHYDPMLLKLRTEYRYRTDYLVNIALILLWILTQFMFLFRNLIGINGYFIAENNIKKIPLTFKLHLLISFYPLWLSIPLNYSKLSFILLYYGKFKMNYSEFHLKLFQDFFGIYCIL